MNGPESMMLEQRHREELQASGLNDKTIEASGIFSDDGKRIREILGNPPKELRGWGTGYVLPFRAFGKTEPDFWRVKLDYPRTNANGRTIKYEQPRGKSNRAYFPPGFEQSLAQGGTILITEGEKKALAGQQAGFPTIGIRGVWSFQSRRLKTDTGQAYGSRELIPDLRDVPWKGHRVVFAFDSDAVRNDSVRIAEAKLAECLKNVGVQDVAVARLPESGGAKVGLDDFVVANGEDALRKVIASAKEAEAPPTPEMMDWARMIIDEEFTTPKGRILQWWRDEFYSHRGTHYIQVPGSELQNTVLLWLDKRTPRATPRLAADIVKCLGAICRVEFTREMPTFLNGSRAKPSGIIAFRNGLIDTTEIGDDFELLAHSPAWFSTSCLPYAFDPTATCPRWLAFLKEVLAEEDRIALLQEWFGLALTCDTTFQKLLLMVGPKRSGKGTILRIMQLVIGSDNCVSPTLASLGSDFGLWPIVGKTLATLPDAHLGHRTDSIRVLEVLKSIVGEDSVSINRKNLPFLPNVRLNVRFIITVNELPRFSDASDALGSRLCLLPFDTSFADRMDRKLETRLRPEAPGILLWALDGLKRLQQEGEFTVPIASEQLLADYRRLVSPVSGFAEDYCETGRGLDQSVDDLFGAWCSWCSENGNKSGSKATFGQHLASAFPNIRRKRRRLNCGGREYCYEGIALNAMGSIAANRKADWRGNENG